MPSSTVDALTAPYYQRLPADSGQHRSPQAVHASLVGVHVRMVASVTKVARHSRLGARPPGETLAGSYSTTITL